MGTGRNGKQRLFTTVPVRAIADPRLTALEFRCLMVISLHDGMSQMKGTGSGCYARTATLANMVGTDISNFSKAVSKLLKFEYLAREQQQSDKRRHTLRVIFEGKDSWRTDQQSADEAEAEIVGEPTNHHPEVVGAQTNDSAKVVGEVNLRNGGNLPKTDPHYIPLNGELDSVETGELNSVETAQLDSELRVSQLTNPLLSRATNAKKDRAEARHSGVPHSAFRALLPPSWDALPTSAQLSHFERAFAKVDRDPAAMQPGERSEFEAWLTNIWEGDDGDQDGHRAQRLLEEMDA